MNWIILIQNSPYLSKIPQNIAKEKTIKKFSINMINFVPKFLNGRILVFSKIKYQNSILEIFLKLVIWTIELHHQTPSVQKRLIFEIT